MKKNRKYNLQLGIRYLAAAVIYFFLSNSVTAQQDTTKSSDLKESAIQQMNAGRYGEAIDFLNKYITSNPREPEAYNLRGYCHEKRGQYQYAVLDYRRAIALSQNYAEARNNLQRTQAVWYEQLRKKIKGHEREIAIDPYNPYNYLEIGKSYRWLEEWALADEWYDKYLQRDPNASPDEIIRYSEILAKVKKIQKGERILKEWVDKYPDDWRLWSKYGYFTMWLGKYKNAENAFKTALGFKPFFQEALDGLDQATKQAYVTQQDPRAFEKEFPIDRYYRIVRNNPRDYNTRFTLVDELIKANRIEEAYQQLLILEIENSNDSRFRDRWDYVTNLRAETYRNKVEEFKEKNKADPRDRIAASKLAEYYQYLEDYQNAQQILEIYFYEVPDERDESIRFQYAKVTSANRKYDLAKETTNRLLDDNPRNLDYQLFRAQLEIWTNGDLDLIKPYLDNVIDKRPGNVDALLAMASYYIGKQEFDNAQSFINRARNINVASREVVTLQSNLDFQRNLFEEERKYMVLEEGRKYVLDGECAKAVPYYEQYLADSEMNYTVMKEFADVLFCAKQYNRALNTYDEVLDFEYNYDAALQRAKLFYTVSDTVNALNAFKELSAKEREFEPMLYLADTYALMGENDSANTIYDSLLTMKIDSNQVKMVEQRIDWIPATGLKGVVKRFPAGLGIAPSLSFYNDNISFNYTKVGGRIDLGLLDWLTLGVSFYRSTTAGNRSSLDSATVAAIDSISGLQYDFSRVFTSFKGHASLRFSDRFRGSIGAGVLNAEAVQQDIETELTLNYDIPDTLTISAIYLNTDASIVLYSPYLSDLTVNGRRMFASQYKVEGKYIHDNEWVFAGLLQYITVNDKELRGSTIDNAGNDFMLRVGKYFDKELSGGYEYYFSNYKFNELASPFYYSPREFESHSIWADFIIDKKEKVNISIGGKLGYVPSSSFVIIEAKFDAFYQFYNNFQLRGTVSLGSTSREDSSYRYFSGGLSAYWTFW
ncbi:MAG: tetratricopeptide repeat protein [Melioribacteraceae bacterium]|nr:tetratricopeptide repeat protein [Melioribacteraceae bacterium]